MCLCVLGGGGCSGIFRKELGYPKWGWGVVFEMEGLKPSANYDMVNAQTAIAIVVKIMLVKLIEKLFKRLKYTDSNDSNHSHVLENSFKTSESLTQSCS